MKRLVMVIAMTMAWSLSSFATATVTAHEMQNTTVVTPQPVLNHTAIPAASPAQTACIYGHGNNCAGEKGGWLKKQPVEVSQSIWGDLQAFFFSGPSGPNNLFEK